MHRTKGGLLGAFDKRCLLILCHEFQIYLMETPTVRTDWLNIDRITVIDGGNGSQGAAKVANYASQVLTATQEGLKETAGLDVTALIESFVGNKNIGSKLGAIKDTMTAEISEEKTILTETGNELETEEAGS